MFGKWHKYTVNVTQSIKGAGTCWGALYGTFHCLVPTSMVQIGLNSWIPLSLLLIWRAWALEISIGLVGLWSRPLFNMLSPLNYGLVPVSTYNVTRAAAVNKYSLLQACVVCGAPLAAHPFRSAKAWARLVLRFLLAALSQCKRWLL